jgi:hypothetical protein
MTIEKLQELKKKYQEKADYFEKIYFDNFHADFTEVVSIIDEFIAAIQVKDPEPAPAQEE